MSSRTRLALGLLGSALFLGLLGDELLRALIQSIEIDDRKVRSIVRGRDPDVSPDGAKLAFAQRKGIYVMPLEGGKPRLIITRGEHPEWSPDGRYLAFTRRVKCGEAGCSGRVFLVRATGGRARAIGPRIFEIGPLSWS